MVKSLQRKILRHYRSHARALPWRIPPGSDTPPDPYRVWLSEVMLQQTTVATVLGRFDAFLARWPDVEALAAAPLEEVLGAWAGLGYYARARNLHACARAVAERGGFPDTEGELRQLPGIGAYTAAAIAAIAFARDAVVVDTNVERVVARLHAVDRPIRDVRALVREKAAPLYDGVEAGAMAQALMDLGATLCRPREPRCDDCPAQSDCAAFASGTPAAFPPAPARTSRPERHGVAWWIERDGALFLTRRPATGLLGGMAALPGPDWQDVAGPTSTGVKIRHVFTHFALTLAIERRAAPPVGVDGWWQPIDRLDEAGLPTLYAKAVAAWRQSEPLLPVAP